MYNVGRDLRHKEILSFVSFSYVMIYFCLFVLFDSDILSKARYWKSRSLEETTFPWILAWTLMCLNSHWMVEEVVRDDGAAS